MKHINFLHHSRTKAERYVQHAWSAGFKYEQVSEGLDRYFSSSITETQYKAYCMVLDNQLAIDLNKQSFQSNIQWPEGTTPNPITTDLHYTRGEASMVCQCLLANGLGEMGKIFPVKTWVSEVEDDE